MKRIFIFLLLFLIFACREAKNSVSIINNSSLKIDSARISGEGINILFREIAPGSEKLENYDHYLEYTYESVLSAKIYSKDTLVTLNGFGYHSNSASIKENLKLMFNKNYTLKEVN